MENYTKISDKLLQNTRLKLTSRIIYARLSYRMRLSVSKNNMYFDQKGHFYYVVYKIKDLMHDCGLGKKAVRNALDQLVDFGLVIKHNARHFTRVKHLELPKFHLETYESAKSIPVKRTNKPKINNHDSNHDNRLKRVEDRTSSTNIKIPKYDYKLDKQNADKASETMSIPKPVTDNMSRDLGGSMLYQCIHILAITSRKHIIKSYGYQQWVKDALNYDINEYFRYNHGEPFAKYIDHGLRKAFHNSKNMYAYFMNVCKHYYNYAIKWFRQNHEFTVQGSNRDPRIPIFSI